MNSQFPNALNGLSVISSPRPGTLPTLHRASSADGLWSPGSSSDDNNSPTVLNRCIWDKPSLVKKVDLFWKDVNLKTNSEDHRSFEGYINESVDVKDEKGLDNKLKEDNLFRPSDQLPQQKCPVNTPIKEESQMNQSKLMDPTDVSFMDIMLINTLDKEPEKELLEEKKFFYSEEDQHIDTSKKIQSELNELKNAAWFQAGIPREIALQILSEEPIGSFIVRESTTKPGCFALSLRVPKDFQSCGISHYLIMNTSKGYKIKGFTKEFSSLTSLITHHSVMPELLPCPLSLPRYRRPPSNSESSDDFLDVDQDKNLLSKLQRLVADLDL